MVKGLAPLIRAVVYSQVIICRRLWMQYVFPHMCGVNQFCIIVVFTAVKPANNILFCIELIQRPESSLRRHKLCSKEDKTSFTCVHRLMTMGHSQNIWRKVPDDAVLHILFSPLFLYALFSAVIWHDRLKLYMHCGQTRIIDENRCRWFSLSIIIDFID